MRGQKGSCAKKHWNSKIIANPITFDEKIKLKKICVNLKLPL